MTPSQVAKIKQGLSAPKLKTYENLGFAPDSADLVRAYVSLQDVSSHLFLPLQMLELSLRNNIHDTLHKRFPPLASNGHKNWFDYIPIADESKGQVSQAYKLAKKDHPSGYTCDDLVSALMFGFWVFMLDSSYRKHDFQYHYVNQDYSNIFPGKTTEGINRIFELLKAINRHRNRLYHHEPVWKAKGVTSLNEAMSQINKIYADVMTALKLVSPEKANLLITMNLQKKFEDCQKEYIKALLPPPVPSVAIA